MDDTQASGQPSPTAPTLTNQEAILVSIGDIGISQNLIVTPNGSAPLAGSQWILRDMSRTETRIPAWAIILAIVFFLACLVGLLFLLVKEKTTTGYVEVQVQSGSLLHVTQIPVSDAAGIAHARQLVTYAQSRAAATRA